MLQNSSALEIKGDAVRRGCERMTDHCRNADAISKLQPGIHCIRKGGMKSLAVCHWWYYICYKLDFPRSIFWQQHSRSLHPSLYRWWVLYSSYSSSGRSKPCFCAVRRLDSKQTNKPEKKEKKRCQYSWEKQLFVLFIGPCCWRETRLDNEKTTPSSVLLLHVNPSLLWIKNRPLICVSLSRPLISHNPSFH